MGLASSALNNVRKIFTSRHRLRRRPDQRTADDTPIVRPQQSQSAQPQGDMSRGDQTHPRTERLVQARAAYDSLSTGMRVTIAVFLVIAIPLAAPAWAIERLIRKWWSSDFEFRAFSATPYFVCVTIAATVAIVATRLFVAQVIAMYLLADMELVCLATCTAIALVNPGRVQTLLRNVSRRTFSPRVITVGRTTIYMAIVSAAYSVWFFGALSFILWQADHTYFGGVSEPSPRVYVFWQFLQNSFLAITNSNNTLSAERFLSQLVDDSELIVGIFLLVFLLAVLVSTWAERARNNIEPSQTVKSNSQDDI